MRHLPLRTAALSALIALAPLAGAASDDDDEIGLGALHLSPGAPRHDAFGPAVSESVLATHRGGADLHVNENNARATVQDNVARNVSTGNNVITESAFSNATGIPMVVQNSGNNVVIQNSTILNLQLK